MSQETTCQLFKAASKKAIRTESRDTTVEYESGLGALVLSPSATNLVFRLKFHSISLEILSDS